MVVTKSNVPPEEYRKQIEIVLRDRQEFIWREHCQSVIQKTALVSNKRQELGTSRVKRGNACIGE